MEQAREALKKLNVFTQNAARLQRRLALIPAACATAPPVW
jgi:hypothetical protein